MAVDLEPLITDLRDESAALSEIVETAGPGALDTPTPAAGWTVGDTLGHLWFFDVRATEALSDPDSFVAGLALVLADPEGYMSRHLDQARALGLRLPDESRSARQDMITALRATDPKARVPWYGPPMSPVSFTTARLMETWAHGQDVADGLGVRRRPTDRLRHVAHLGVATRGFSYLVRGQRAPDVPVFVSLRAPGGEVWTWGDDTASDRVEGPAEDFCLLVTQRRHLADLDLLVTGEAAAEWLSIAQAFAGEPSLTDPARRTTSSEPQAG